MATPTTTPALRDVTPEDFRALCLASDDLNLRSKRDRNRLGLLIEEAAARGDIDLVTWMATALRF